MARVRQRSRGDGGASGEAEAVGLEAISGAGTGVEGRCQEMKTAWEARGGVKGSRGQGVRGEVAQSPTACFSTVFPALPTLLTLLSPLWWGVGMNLRRTSNN